jgi:hypothetical protein
MSEQKCETTHYFDGTKWQAATEKSCETCNNFIAHRCILIETDMDKCLSNSYKNLWSPKEEPKTDRTCDTCVNFKSDEKCNFGKPYCSLLYCQRKACLSSLIRQFWYKKEETKNKNSEEMQKHDNDFNETLRFETKQHKKIIKGIEIKPTKTTIHETYVLAIKDIEFLFRKAFDLNSNDSLKIIKGETVSGDVFSIEIERNS